MLTEKRCRDAKPGEKVFYLWDSKVQGLGVRVSPGGAKSYVLVTRINSRQHWVTLARAGEVPLAKMRQIAGEMKLRIQKGEDPFEHKEAPTMEQAVSRFFDEYAPKQKAKGKLKEKTLSDYRYQWRKHLAPEAGRQEGCGHSATGHRASRCENRKTVYP